MIRLLFNVYGIVYANTVNDMMMGGVVRLH